MEKKKMVLAAVALCVLIAVGSATAWSLGNTLTPTEFANTDLDKHDFNPTPTGTKIIGAGSEGALYEVDIQVNSFIKNSSTEYEEVNITLTPKVGVRAYVNCRDSGKSMGECDAQLKASLISKAAQQVISEKDSLQREQIEAKKFAQYADELKAGDITISQAEINNAIGQIE